MAPTYLTQGGLDEIKAELVTLKTKTRRELADRIETAKALGDLSENAEYHEAKDALGMAEGRIREIEEMLKNVSIIANVKGTDTVNIGSNVEVEVNGATRTYEIVGSNEANPLSGRISNESPTGKAFLGQAVGDAVSVETPAGTMVYKILKIS